MRPSAALSNPAQEVTVENDGAPCGDRVHVAGSMEESGVAGPPLAKESVALHHRKSS